MRRVNRCALVVRPSQPFVDWVRQVDRDYAAGLSDEDLLASDEVFLTPLFHVPEDTEEYLEKNATRVFEAMLHRWCYDPRKWPKERGWGVFQEWLNYEVAVDLHDLPAAPLRHGERASYGGKEPEFEFWESVLDDYEEQVHHVRSEVWSDGLFREFEGSPEANALQTRVGGARLVLDYVHVYRNEPFSEINAELLEDAMFSALQLRGFEIGLDGASIVEELKALFGYVQRVVDFEPADACLELLKREGLSAELDAAMQEAADKHAANKRARKADEERLAAGQALLASGLWAGLQKPFVVREPELGRNDPCACGSGKKYKRCCLTVS
ncbi:hypothetical protein EA187_10475 [Lujinxingia sediminis]|uniref:SEC-C motif-containing protein n=1 Tax=Lujinxingia sediminis TaxID=2480984 RepID=A0ABY0CTL9_9DELT|nr:SEC-C metal-binding domain-containing protein [Lujinxingia sediminis]RVU43981.1 hypothetical protein EA187_10475 [Lujinxingia sediminis]